MPEDKPLIASQIAERNAIHLSSCVAFGDSLSDVPLFEQVGCAVSVNGDEHLRELADVFYIGSSMYEAYCAAMSYVN
ncbi:MAG: HAD hydrolase family protein [Trueperaceae bacterium]